jgi:hypothetical protein
MNIKITDLKVTAAHAQITDLAVCMLDGTPLDLSLELFTQGWSDHQVVSLRVTGLYNVQLCFCDPTLIIKANKQTGSLFLEWLGDPLGFTIATPDGLEFVPVEVKFKLAVEYTYRGGE